MPSTRSGVIVVSAVIIIDRDGRLLGVRKCGTSTVILPGGKPELDEEPVQAVIRECQEELGLRLDRTKLRWFGVWEAPAANEPGHTVRAEVFRYLADDSLYICAAAEIAEIIWIDLSASHGRYRLAPLLSDHVLPSIRRILLH